MNRYFLRVWRGLSAYFQWSPNWSWFTPRVAVTLVLLFYVVSWIFILVVGKQHFLAMRAAARPHWFMDSHGRTKPYILLGMFILDAVLLFLFFWSWSGRRLNSRYRSALLAMALAGILGLVTQVWLSL